MVGDRGRSGIERKKKYSDPSDSDSIKLPIPIPIATHCPHDDLQWNSALEYSRRNYIGIVLERSSSYRGREGGGSKHCETVMDLPKRLSDP